MQNNNTRQPKPTHEKPDSKHFTYILGSSFDSRCSHHTTDGNRCHPLGLLAYPASNRREAQHRNSRCLLGPHRRKAADRGGANFPDRTPAANGEKKYHRDLYIYDTSQGWQIIPDALPAPRAYGVSVTLPEGVLCIGGCNAEECTNQVLLLTLDGNQPRLTPWPPLPRPLANAAGALVGHRIYVAGGIEQVKGAAATRNFFMLDLQDLERGWRELPPWPGPARHSPVSGPAKRRVRQLFLPLQRPRFFRRYSLGRPP